MTLHAGCRGLLTVGPPVSGRHYDQSQGNPRHLDELAQSEDFDPDEIELQGNFPVNEDAFARVAAAGSADGLDTLLVAECPVLEWQAVVHDYGGGVIAV